MFSKKLTTSIAAGTAAIAVAIGAYTIVNPASSNGASGTTTVTAAAAALPGQHQPNQTVVGKVPQGWQSGSGTIVTGTAADKAKAAALAKYPGGTINRVLKLSDGSYAVHMIKISFPHHVFVSTTFKVTGAIG
jgi:hypothetical protein